jgi:hypothetical protein
VSHFVVSQIDSIDRTLWSKPLGSSTCSGMLSVEEELRLDASIKQASGAIGSRFNSLTNHRLVTDTWQTDLQQGAYVRLAKSVARR